MPRFTFVALTNAKPGREAEFKEWYAKRHVPDVLNIEGIVSAERFQLAGNLLPGETPAFLALYRIETDDLGKVIKELQTRAGTERMPISDASGDGTVAGFYAALGPVVKG